MWGVPGPGWKGSSSHRNCALTLFSAGVPANDGWRQEKSVPGARGPGGRGAPACAEPRRRCRGTRSLLRPHQVTGARELPAPRGGGARSRSAALSPSARSGPNPSGHRRGLGGPWLPGSFWRRRHGGVLGSPWARGCFWEASSHASPCPFSSPPSSCLPYPHALDSGRALSSTWAPAMASLSPPALKSQACISHCRHRSESVRSRATSAASRCSRTFGGPPLPNRRKPRLLGRASEPLRVALS